MRFRISSLATPIAILIAGAMISGAIVWSMRQMLEGVQTAYQQAYQQQAAAQAASPAQPPAPEVDSSLVSTKDSPFIGSPDAPVTIAYWFDYQCPFCQALEMNVLASLITDYVTPGKVKVVFKDYTFLGPDSVTAAVAARAVWDAAPEKFFDWHHAMFVKQDAENAGWGSKTDILELTKTIPGIDAEKVEGLMTSKATEYNQALQADGYEGSTMGVNGTPGAIIGKQLIVGAQPYGNFKAAVDKALAQAAAKT